MTEYSRIARGYFTSTGGAKIINLPFQPDFVSFINYTTSNAAATSQNVVAAQWDVSMGQGFAVQQGYNTTPTLIWDTVAANGISTFSAGQALQFGPALAISGITQSSTAPQVTTVNAHGLTSGNVVMFQNLYQTSTTGMPQMSNVPFTVTVTGTTTFTVPWNNNQSNYTALSGSPAGAQCKQVLNPYLFFPGDTVVAAVSTGTTTTITTTSAHNFVVGQEIAFSIPSAWGTTQLNSLPNSTIPGSPMYGYVTSVTSYNVFVCNINSTGFTAYTNNPTIASLPGLSYPQVRATGSINTGGVIISTGSPLYPAPQFGPIGTTLVSTINGPAVRGSFVNNSSAGFIIGVGAGTNLTTSVLVGASSNLIYWQAELHDITVVG